MMQCAKSLKRFGDAALREDAEAADRTGFYRALPSMTSEKVSRKAHHFVSGHLGDGVEADGPLASDFAGGFACKLYFGQMRRHVMELGKRRAIADCSFVYGRAHHSLREMFRCVPNDVFRFVVSVDVRGDKNLRDVLFFAVL